MEKVRSISLNVQNKGLLVSYASKWNILRDHVEINAVLRQLNCAERSCDIVLLLEPWKASLAGDGRKGFADLYLIFTVLQLFPSAVLHMDTFDISMFMYINQPKVISM